MSDKEIITEDCPFCGTSPKARQGKVTHCQLHGEPAQAVIVYCDFRFCHVKPSVTAGDIYNGGYYKAKLEAVKKWNARVLPEPKHAPATDVIAQVIEDSADLCVGQIAQEITTQLERHGYAIDATKTLGLELSAAQEELVGLEYIEVSRNNLLAAAKNLLKNIGNQYLPTEHPQAGFMTGEQVAIKEMQQTIDEATQPNTNPKERI